MLFLPGNRGLSRSYHRKGRPHLSAYSTISGHLRTQSMLCLSILIGSNIKFYNPRRWNHHLLPSHPAPSARQRQASCVVSMITLVYACETPLQP